MHPEIRVWDSISSAVAPQWFWDAPLSRARPCWLSPSQLSPYWLSLSLRLPGQAPSIRPSSCFPSSLFPFPVGLCQPLSPPSAPTRLFPSPFLPVPVPVTPVPLSRRFLSVCPSMPLLPRCPALASPCWCLSGFPCPASPGVPLPAPSVPILVGSWSLSLCPGLSCPGCPLPIPG